MVTILVVTIREGNATESSGTRDIILVYLFTMHRIVQHSIDLSALKLSVVLKSGNLGLNTVMTY